MVAISSTVPDSEFTSCTATVPDVPEAALANRYPSYLPSHRGQACGGTQCKVRGAHTHTHATKAHVSVARQGHGKAAGRCASLSRKQYEECREVGRVGSINKRAAATTHSWPPVNTRPSLPSPLLATPTMLVPPPELTLMLFRPWKVVVLSSVTDPDPTTCHTVHTATHPPTAQSMHTQQPRAFRASSMQGSGAWDWRGEPASTYRVRPQAILKAFVKHKLRVESAGLVRVATVRVTSHVAARRVGCE
jgi:hypothetical protein